MVATKPVDFGKGGDGLARLVRETMTARLSDRDGTASLQTPVASTENRLFGLASPEKNPQQKSEKQQYSCEDWTML
jgi:hypothetical protein